MPGPILPSRQFPGVSSLPDPVQKVLEFFFPPDDAMPSIGTVVGAKGVGKSLDPLLRRIAESRAAGTERAAQMPIEAPLRPVEPLYTQALAPLHKSIQRGKEAVPGALEVLRDEQFPSPGFLTAHPTIQELVLMLRKIPDESLKDPNKLAAIDRVTNRRPIMNAQIKAPKDFYFDRSGLPSGQRRATSWTPDRDPLVKEMIKRYKKFDKDQALLRALDPRKKS